MRAAAVVYVLLPAVVACGPIDPAVEALAGADAALQAAREAGAAEAAADRLAMAQQRRSRAAWHLEEGRSPKAVAVAGEARAAAEEARTISGAL